MSGIVGFWSPDGRPAEGEEIGQMLGAIAHRGPDGTRTKIDGAVALAYLHLETRIKPSPVAQPFTDSEAGLAIVLDGRIDNREELTTLLESNAVVCRSGSDAELILRVYQILGSECPNRLLGDFAFAIWDSPRQRFFCARDQIGVKPFVYYYAQNSLFAFGSEINGIIALDRVPRRLNEFRLADYLVNELDREDTEGTFYQGIKRLPNGHFLMVERDSAKIARYWYPPLKEGVRYRSIEAYGEAFRELLMKATADRVRGTKRVACALSGGLDSSSVVGIVRALSNESLCSEPSVFSLVDPQDLDSLSMIHSVINMGGIEPHLSQPDNLTADSFDIPNLIRGSNDPFEADQGWFSWITYIEAKKKGHRTFLDGLDGDQMHPYLLCIDFLLRTGRWSAAIREARHLAPDWDLSPWRMLLNYGLSSCFPRTVRTLVKTKQVFRKPPYHAPSEWIDEDLARRTKVAERRAAILQGASDAKRDLYHTHSLGFTVGWLSFALALQEALAARQGIELLHPLADRRIAEFFIGLPIERKLHYPSSKVIMRSAMSGLLPEPLLKQRRLHHPGFRFHNRLLDCQSEWLKSGVEMVLQSLGGYVNLGAIRRLAEDYRKGNKAEAGLPLWNVVVLAEWMDMNRVGG